MSGWKRAPSSLVKKATASGRRVTTPASSSVSMTSSPARTPSAPSYRPPVSTVSMWLPIMTGRAVLEAAPHAHDIADRVDRDGEAEVAHPAGDEVAALPFGLGEGETVDPAVRPGADFGQPFEARGESRAVHSKIVSHGERLPRPTRRRGGNGRRARLGCDNETPPARLRPDATHGPSVAGGFDVRAGDPRRQLTVSGERRMVCAPKRVGADWSAARDGGRDEDDPVHAQRQAPSVRDRTRPAADRDLARNVRDQVGQVRVFAAARVRRLPDPVRRSAEARLRRARRAGPGPFDRHPRRRFRQRAPPLRRRFPGGRRPAMRVLHAGLRPPHQMDDRPGREADPRRDRPADRRAPLPLHRLRQDHRRDRAHPGGEARRRRASGDRRGRRRRQVAASATRAPSSRSASGPSSSTSTRPACSMASSSCRRTRARRCSASTSRRRARFPGSSRSRPRPTFRATAGSDRSSPTGPSSSPRARRRATSATCWRRSPPRRPALAREAAALVEVEYEPLPPVLDPAEAIKPGAPQVNPRHGNVLSTTRYARGDVEAALAASAHVVSGEWRTQRIEHLFLEPEACLARPLPDGRLHVYTQGQGIFEDRRQIASVLGEPEERLFVELVPNGGAFGGKEDMTIQAQTALLARLTGRPVRIELSRDEVDPHASQAPPADHDLHRRLRRGWPADRGQDPYSRRLRRLRLGRRQGARARRRPRLRALPDARARGRGGGGLHQQSAVRRDARLRRQPDELRHRGLPRPARGQGRPRRLGDALAEHRAGRRSDDHRTSSRKVCRGREDPACGEAGL